VALEVRILAVWAWWRQGSLVRRRILALTAPVAGSAAMVTYGFAGASGTSGPPPRSPRRGTGTRRTP